MRAQGVFDPAAGQRFNPAKLLVDPLATRLDRPFRLDASLFDARIHGAAEDHVDSAAVAPKAIVEAAPPFRAPRRASVEWRDLVIYEMQVRGFTALCDDVPAGLRGTFAGLGHPASIAHLTRLGITAVELLPAAAWIDERHLPPLGLANSWGYNPIALLAPDPRLAPGGFDEVRAAVEALQGAGIAVLLDVVLNHTGESDELGPTLSLRGLDNSGYYRLQDNDKARYVNDAGCGDVLALERPQALRLALDALRAWACRAGVDGFRYDLATVLARRGDGFDPDHPLLAAIAQDPWLRDLIHIAEPWDMGPGGYQLGAFPSAWGEWNDRARDTFRRFWRGDEGLRGDLASRLAGSADIFAGRNRKLSRSINFITAHDGFTLADLVAYTRKRNEANGEFNRDGTDDNLSWNCGAEGETPDAAVNARRQADARSLLTTLLAARGTPMLGMGDELGRTQKGNNNAYAQDNPLSWIDWSSVDEQLIEFSARLIRLRRATGALSAETPLTGAPVDATGIPDVEWLNADGEPLRIEDWGDRGARTLAAVFYDEGAGDLRAPGRAAVFINGSGVPALWRVPHPRDQHVWCLEIDSSQPARVATELEEDRLIVAARAVVILAERFSPSPARRAEVPDHVLDALASAAGVALDWFDVDGKRHLVPADAKRAILSGLGLPAFSVSDARASLVVLAEERELRPLPVALALIEGRRQAIRLGGRLADLEKPAVLTIELDDGSSRRIVIAPGDGRHLEIAAADGRKANVRDVVLPMLPAGRHRIRSDEAPDSLSHVAVSPETAHLPDILHHEKVFGLTAQLYSLRRDGDQGIGDFTTLKILAGAAAGAGAAMVGINPLHALFPREPDRASPYHPSDRRFLNPLAIDLFDLPDELLPDPVRADLRRAEPEAARLSALGCVDYRAVNALKDAILRRLHSVFRERAGNAPSDRLVEDYRRFVEAGGDRLRRFAIFSAIEDFVGGPLDKFPSALKSPDAPAVAAFAAAHEDAVDRAMFAQWLADRQFAAAAQSARFAGLALTFFRDLAVGCAPDGAEAWAQAHLLMRGLSIGAPPDPLGPNGQVWNLPPANPRMLLRDGFDSFGALIRANMTYAGVLRIDHVLGLKRLFLVPDGAEGKDGAYLSYPFENLLGQVALESTRAQTAVVGEDLGTVPEGLRDQLARANILSYRVMRFEREGKSYIPPDRYPHLAAACVATHDLPPLAGWWAGVDLAESNDLGLLSEPLAAQASRRVEKTELLEALADVAPPGNIADPDAPLSVPAACAVHDYIARSNALIALVQVDDLAFETRPVNLPGTDRERPNWRRKLMAPLKTLLSSERALAILEVVRNARRGRND
ncbi:glycogen operon protein [Methylocapsa palsarum]|uniref:4-alpha-glucanotransferase n=1 Tax=Methylocapsa palsarum TaxID=1612308 RepID=A0A1I3XF76_9HYPH|nr:glycogen operon protein [Methylocapsa palsarum]